MSIFRQFIIVFFIVAFGGLLYGQNSNENELVTIDGQKFILHRVRTGETIYSISRDFKTDPFVLKKFNPLVENGLNIGDILKIPFNENINLSELPGIKKGDPSGFLMYKIESNGETAYSISKKYGITIEEIYAYNPTIQRLRKGMSLRIPVWGTVPTEAEKHETVRETTVIKNENNWKEHIVVSGETLYSISKKYNITTDEILKYNQQAKNLKAGVKLIIPQNAVADNKAVEPLADDNVQTSYILHTVVSGETLYGISRKYNVGEEEIKKANPAIAAGLRAGTAIRIPVLGSKTEQLAVKNKVAGTIADNLHSTGVPALTGKTPADCGTKQKYFTHEPVVVALFLPLFLDANEKLNKDVVLKTDTTIFTKQFPNIGADTIIEQEKPVQMLRQFYGNSENFIQFYEGVLIAVDSMQKAGMQIILNVYDTKDNPETVRKIINADSFASTSLMLGPVYENIQKEVSRAAIEYKIPMVSPLTPKSAVLDNTPLFFQINPTREYVAEATMKFIAKEYAGANIILVKTSHYDGTQENQLVELLRENLAKQGNNGRQKFTEYDFRRGRSQGLKDILVTDKENVVFIPTSDEGELSVAISNINNLAAEYPITLVAATNYQQRYPSIEIAHYHNLKMKYINPYWIDYQKRGTKDYILKFISNFGTEPNSYGVQGFDVAWYFLNVLFNYGKDFENCLQYFDTKLIQGSYSFRKVSASGGYMNHGVSVISYNRNFAVERLGTIGYSDY